MFARIFRFIVIFHITHRVYYPFRTIGSWNGNPAIWQIGISGVPTIHIRHCLHVDTCYFYLIFYVENKILNSYAYNMLNCKVGSSIFCVGGPFTGHFLKHQQRNVPHECYGFLLVWPGRITVGILKQYIQVKSSTRNRHGQHTRNGLMPVFFPQTPGANNSILSISVPFFRLLAFLPLLVAQSLLSI